MTTGTGDTPRATTSTGVWYPTRLGAVINENQLLDEIAQLVDDSLARGDQSDSFRGTGFRQNHPCPWCSEGWHFLPITERMREGEYATDEFGQGIVDPSYSYQTDQSAVICPGSEFHGPEHKTRMWDKQRRERVTAGPTIPGPPSHSQSRRKIRFIGPFEPWTIILDDERVIEDVIPGLPGAPSIPDRSRPWRPVVVEQRLTATFELNEPLRNMSGEWFAQNYADIHDMVYTADGSVIHMKPIVIPFTEIAVYAQDPSADYPDYIDFSTNYPIERHPWFWEYLGEDDTRCRSDPHRVATRGHEPDFVIIDEAYELVDEEQIRHDENTRRAEAAQEAFSETQR